MLSCALGIRQPKLDDGARAFFREAQPWAFILFREACVNPAQVRALCAELRDSVGRDALVWIDQEGGRVARLKAPEWPVWPAPGRYGAIYARDPEKGVEATRLGHRLIAHELRAIGVDADFAPVLDVPIEGSDKAVVGDRAFATDPEAIAVLARTALEGLHAGGVAGCIKHMPGHGRAMSDSHFSLPRVRAKAAELERDLTPFVQLADAEAAMTAHIVYEAWDGGRPATCSPLVIGGIIRERIGFQGLLFSDDLDMKALAKIGGLADRATAALGAGCDIVLQCSGALDEMEATAKGCKPVSVAARRRIQAVETLAKRQPGEFDAGEGWARFRELML